MTERDRQHAYTLLCEIADEPTAEYLMSRMPTEAISELATKADLDDAVAAIHTTLTHYATKADLHAATRSMVKTVIIASISAATLLVAAMALTATILGAFLAAA